VFRPGTSVILKDDPKGPVLTVLHSRLDQAGVFYRVAWLDAAKVRREADFREADVSQMRI
jgi:hypothetical protein